jgi:hypothetical protein
VRAGVDVVCDTVAVVVAQRVHVGEQQWKYVGDGVHNCVQHVECVEQRVPCVCVAQCECVIVSAAVRGDCTGERLRCGQQWMGGHADIDVQRVHGAGRLR